jgi:hypothetical protein
MSLLPVFLNRLQPSFPAEPGFLAFGVLAGSGVDELFASRTIDLAA